MITNKERAALAEHALRRYIEAKGETFERCIGEISDLMHLAVEGSDEKAFVELMLQTALGNFQCEQEEEGRDNA